MEHSFLLKSQIHFCLEKGLKREKNRLDFQKKKNSGNTNLMTMK